MKRKEQKISEIYEGLFDGPHATPPVSDSGGIYLGISNITSDGHIDLSNIKYISEDDLPKWTKRVIPKEGDIVFSYEATLNLYAIIPAGFHGCLGRRMALIRPDNKKVCGKYLYYYFFSPEWRETVAENTITGATVDRIPIAKFPDFLIRIPDVKIQKKIASVLSAYDDLIENNQKQIKLLEEAAQRLYKEWFVDLRFPGHENVNIVDGVPEGWVTKKIKELGFVITGKTPSTTEEKFYGGDIPFVKIPDMHKGIYPITTEISLTKDGADTQKNKYIPKGSIMVSCIATVGLVNIAIKECQTNQQINSIVLDYEKDLYYVFFNMQRLKMLLEGVGSNGATMTNVNKNKFSNLELRYPTEKLRNYFFDLCEPIFKKIYKISVSNIKLQEARDRLLPKLISGEIII